MPFLHEFCPFRAPLVLRLEACENWVGGVNSGLGPWECNNNYGVNMGEGTSESLSVSPPSPYSQPVVGAGSKGGRGGAVAGRWAGSADSRRRR